MQRAAAPPRRVLGWLLALVALTGCEPGVIAPLPSPNTPDRDHIAVSSLGLVVDDNERLVAIVGFDGAVDGLGELTVANERTGTTERVTTTGSGSFSASVFGRAGDDLKLAYINEDGVASDPIQVTVSEYDLPEPTRQPEPSDPAPPAIPGSGQYETPGQDGDASGCDEVPEGEDCGLAGEDDGQRLDVVWSFDGSQLTIYGDAGFTSPGANVVVANNASGAVHLTTADDSGAVILQFPALTGDQILMFAQSAEDPSLTSPAIHFAVPASGDSGGANSLPTPEP